MYLMLSIQKKLEETLTFIQKFFLKISDKQKSQSDVLQLISCH